MFAFQVILLIVAVCLSFFAAYQLYLAVEENIRISKLSLESQIDTLNKDFELKISNPTTENGQNPILKNQETHPILAEVRHKKG